MTVAGGYMHSTKRYCPICGSKLVEDRCKLVCRNHGIVSGCHDGVPAFQDDIYVRNNDQR